MQCVSRWEYKQPRKQDIANCLASKLWSSPPHVTTAAINHRRTLFTQTLEEQITPAPGENKTSGGLQSAARPLRASRATWPSLLL
jgi:hypothetical protein